LLDTRTLVIKEYHDQWASGAVGMHDAMEKIIETLDDIRMMNNELAVEARVVLPF
jgi:hypothetical protein